MESRSLGQPEGRPNVKLNSSRLVPLPAAAHNVRAGGRKVVPSGNARREERGGHGDSDVMHNYVPGEDEGARGTEWYRRRRR